MLDDEFEGHLSAWQVQLLVTSVGTNLFEILSPHLICHINFK